MIAINPATWVARLDRQPIRLRHILNKANVHIMQNKVLLNRSLDIAIANLPLMHRQPLLRVLPAVPILRSHQDLIKISKASRLSRLCHSPRILL